MSAFTEATAKGRSLIFVQTALDHHKVMRSLANAKVQTFSTIELGSSRAFVQYLEYLPRNAALVAMAFSLPTGARVKADRIVWIEGETHDRNSVAYHQAMARVVSAEVPRIHIRGGAL